MSKLPKGFENKDDFNDGALGNKIPSNSDATSANDSSKNNDVGSNPQKTPQNDDNDSSQNSSDNGTDKGNNDQSDNNSHNSNDSNSNDNDGSDNQKTENSDSPDEKNNDEADKEKENPFDSLKDKMNPTKSLTDALKGSDPNKSTKDQGKDIAAKFAKDQAKKGLKKGAVKGAVVGGKATGGLYLLNKLLNGLRALLTSILNSAPVQAAITIVSMVTSITSTISSFITGLVANVGSLLGIGTTAAGVVTGGVMSGIALVVTIGGMAVGSVFMNPIQNTDPSCSTLPTEDTSVYVDGSGAGGGDWLQKGTTGYKNAKYYFDLLTKKVGFSGAGGAGAVANGRRESGVELDPKSKNPGGGVAGTFQWSGWNGSQKNKGNRIAGGGFIDPYKDSDLTKENEGKLLVWELNRSKKDVKMKVGKAKDPVQAAKDWSVGYEGIVATDLTQTKESDISAWAKSAYKTFGGSSITANDSLLGSSDDTASENDNKAAEDSQKNCGDDVGGDNVDGTGSIKEKPNGFAIRWKPNDVPADVKKYIQDPKKVGLEWEGTGKGWVNHGNNNHGQCVPFATSYMASIWPNAKPRLTTQYGKQNAQNWADDNNGKVSNTPKAGSMVSVPVAAKELTGGNIAGHTFVVQHVLANGDIVYVEQNMMYNGIKYSGDDAGKPGTWNFGVMAKSYYQKNKLEFYTPKGKPQFKK